MADSSLHDYPDGRRPPERVPKSERILNLIAVLLRADEPLPVTEILGKVTGYDDAASRESLMRRFERDKKVLRDMGIPVEHSSPGVFGTEGYKISRDAYFLDEVSLPPASGQILRGLFAWAHAGGGELSADLRSALVKLGYFVEGGENGQAPGPARATEALEPMQVVDPKLSTGPQVGKNLELLSLAVFRQKRITMRYYTFSRDQESTRDVDPYGLGFAGQAWNKGAWYLVGYCHLREGVRIFKLQRIQGEVTFATQPDQGPDYMIPPGFRVRDHLGRTRWEWRDLTSALAGDDAAEPFEARVRFPSAIAGEVKALVPSAKSVERGRDHETLAFQVTNRRPFARFLLRFVPRITVVSPPDLDAAMRELAREVLAQYKGGA